MAKQKQEAPLTMRLTPELESRFVKASEKVKLTKNGLAKQAIEAAVDAIEEHAGQIVVPIRFEVKQVPSDRKVK